MSGSRTGAVKNARKSIKITAVGGLVLAGMLPAGAASAATVRNGGSLPSSITVWSYFDTTGQLNFEKVAAAAFNKHFPSVHVDYVNLPFASLDPKLMAAATTHSGPDVVIDNPVVDFPELSHAGALGDMSKYAHQLGTPFPFPKNVQWSYNGKLETIQSYVNLVGLYYNQTILSKLHLSVPKTITQLQSDLKVIKAHGYTGLILEADNTSAWNLYPFLASNGVNFCNLSSPKTTTTLNMLHTWAKDGYIPSNWDTLNQTNSVPLFLAGKSAFMENGNWLISQISKGAKFKFGTAPMPAGPGGSHVLLGGEGEAIGGFSKYPAIDWDYLKYGWFAHSIGKTLLKDTGSVVSRTDLTAEVKAFPYEGAFLKELATAGSWPKNTQVNKAFTDLGSVYSGFASGSMSPSAAAKDLASTAKADYEAGKPKGGC